MDPGQGSKLEQTIMPREQTDRLHNVQLLNRVYMRLVLLI